jgi:hypothetical protein
MIQSKIDDTQLFCVIGIIFIIFDKNQHETMRKNWTFLLCIIILASYNCKNEEFVLPESIRKISIFELNNSCPEYDIINDTVIIDPRYERVPGLIEIDRKFDMKIFKRSSYQGDYLFGTSKVPDKLRSIIIQSIESFKVDSVDLAEKAYRIYDGYIYFMLIEKDNNEGILLSGIPNPVSDELKDISLFLRDSTRLYANKYYENQDSIKKYVRQYDKYRPEEYALPPLPSKQQLEIKFSPPQIIN